MLSKKTKMRFKKNVLHKHANIYRREAWLPHAEEKPPGGRSRNRPRRRSWSAAITTTLNLVNRPSPARVTAARARQAQIVPSWAQIWLEFKLRAGRPDLWRVVWQTRSQLVFHVVLACRGGGPGSVVALVCRGVWCRGRCGLCRRWWSPARSMVQLMWRGLGAPGESLALVLGRCRR